MKERERKELERLEKLRTTIEKSPLTKQILAEEAAAILVTRKEAAEKIADLKKEQDEIIPRLQAELTGKEAEYLKVKAALATASDEFRKAKLAQLSKSHALESAISKQKEILIETAFSEIDEGITFFQEKLNFLRSPGRITRTAAGAEKNIFTMKKATREKSNYEPVRDALSYSQAAIKTLETLKLTPALDVEKIEQMKVGIPDILVYKEVVGEKPLAKG